MKTINILHVFNNHKEMMTYITDTIFQTVEAAEFNLKSCTMTLGNLRVLFAVITNEEEYVQIAGKELHMVHYHYRAEESVRGYILSRVRGQL